MYKQRDEFHLSHVVIQGRISLTNFLSGQKCVGFTKIQSLIVACPYCHAEAVAKLDPYKKEKKTVLRGVDEDDRSIGYEYEFPEVIPTQEPE